MFSIPQSTSFVAVFKAFLSSDHVSEATGKTIAITISKNGGSFANPNAGATNATEIANGWYKVTLDTTDTATLGILALRGAVSGIDDVGDRFYVVKATNGGLTALPDTAVTTNASLLTSGTGTAQLSVASGQVDLGKILGTAVSTPATAGILDVNVKNIDNDAASASGTVTFPNATLASTTNITAAAGIAVSSIGAGVITAASIAADAITDAKVASDVTIASVTGAVGSVTGAVGSVTGNVGGNVVGSVASVAAAVSITGDLSATMKTSVTTAATAATPTAAAVTGAVGSVTGLTASDVAAIKAKTDNLPPSPAAVGSAMTLSGAYDAAKTAATQTSVDDLPTNAELATALAGADDATLAAIAALTIPTAVAIRTEMDSNSTKLAHLDADVSTRLPTSSYTAPANSTIAAIDAKTTNLPSDPADQSLIIAATNSLASAIAALPTTSTIMSADIKKVNGVTVHGDGSGTAWGP